MAISTLHRIDQILIPGGTFPIITNSRWNAGIESMIERPAGPPHPMFRGNLRQRPVVEFSTPQLATALGIVPVGGAAFGAISTFLKRATATGTVSRLSGAHKRVVINSSLVHWTQIRLAHNGKCEIQLVITANYDGVNDPFVYAAGVTLSGNLTCDEFFGLGPVGINGTNIPGCQEVTVQSGVQLVQEGDASEEFDTYVGIEITEPSVTIQTKEAVNWSTLGLRGVGLDGSTGLVFYGRRFANEESRVANDVADHILFQGLFGTAIPMDTNGESNSPITDTLKVELISGDDGTLPLICTPGVVIP